LEKRMTRPTTIVSASLLLAAAGCTVGPEHAPPQVTTPAAWPEPIVDGLTEAASDLSAWWRSFGDPVLDSLVDRALAGSPDLRAAAARVREARALRGRTAADQWPTIDVTGSASYERSSENSGFSGSGAPGEQTDLYQAGFDATWELDVFGGVRRTVEAADADVDAAVESRRGVQVTLLAEVARNYIEFRSFQDRLAIALRNVAIQQDTLDLSQERMEAGFSSELEVAQALAQLEGTRSQIPVQETGLKRAVYRLDVLLGLAPGALMKELTGAAPLPPTPAEIPVGLPAELLRRRPDIREAERAVAAATARIGSATADLYPRFALLGSFGLESEDFGDFFDANSQYWSLGPFSVRWPVFDAGRIRNNIRVQEARHEQLIIAYERTVLEAYEEVAGALVGYAQVRLRRDALARAVEADQRAVDLATELWTRGLTDFLNVLETQQALFQLQDQLAESEAAVATNLVALYKALGGGWTGSQRLDGDAVKVSRR
jgi:multidrug efflux system outer membrane protein